MRTIRLVTAITLAIGVRASAEIKLDAPAPDFTVRVISGDSAETLSLADFKGQTLIVEFWATWCGPCHSVKKDLIALHEAMHDKGLRILAVSAEHPGHVESYLKKNPVPYITAIDRHHKTNEVYGIKAIPRAFLIDSEGTLRWYGSPSLLSVEAVNRFLDTGTPPWQRHRSERNDDRPKGATILRFDLSYSRAPKPNTGIAYGYNGTQFNMTANGRTPEVILRYILDASESRIKCDASVNTYLYDIALFYRPIRGDAFDRRPIADLFCQQAGFVLEEYKEKHDVWIVEYTGKRPPPFADEAPVRPEGMLASHHNPGSMREVIRGMESEFDVFLDDQTNLDGLYAIWFPVKCSFEQMRETMQQEFQLTMRAERRPVKLYRLSEGPALKAQHESQPHK